MNCAYGGACEGATQPFWIRSVGTPLCERHTTTVQHVRETFDHVDDSRRALELLTAIAVTVLRDELAGRHLVA
jgi:hypothetical protein